MRITRTGALRNAGTALLVSADLAKPGTSSSGKVWFSRETQGISFRSQGMDNRGIYNYDVTLTSREIVQFVELMVRGVAEDSASRAIGLSAVTILRELLVPKDMPAKRQ